MRYLLAPDSFKEAASAQAVAESIRRGVAAGDPGAECRMMPLSDGGEGLTDALVQATGGEVRLEHAHDALGRPIITRYGFLGEGGFGTSHDGENPRTAVVELAAASGIERISPADRDPLAASTFGTGELIRAAIDAGAERIVLGLGGSATTDGGTGLAQRSAIVSSMRTIGVAAWPAAHSPGLPASTTPRFPTTCETSRSYWHPTSPIL